MSKLMTELAKNNAIPSSDPLANKEISMDILKQTNVSGAGDKGCDHKMSGTGGGGNYWQNIVVLCPSK